MPAFTLENGLFRALPFGHFIPILYPLQKLGCKTETTTRNPIPAPKWRTLPFLRRHAKKILIRFRTMP